METFLMNPYTGSVDTLENWLDDFESWPADQRADYGWPEDFDDADLIEVVRNIEGEPGYNPSYTNWRPAA